MSTIAEHVLPVFLLILAGWLAVRTGYLSGKVGDAMGEFVYRIAIPVMLFKTMATADAHGASPVRLWLAYFSGVAVAWTLGHLVATRIFGEGPRIGVLAGISAAFANNVFIGLPLVSRLVGDSGTVALSILLAVHLPVMMVAGTVLMDRAEAREQGRAASGLAGLLGQVARNLVTNPLIVGIAAGLVFRLGGMPLAGLPLQLADQIATVSGPVALISIGMAASSHSGTGFDRFTAIVAVLKLVALPASVWFFAHLFGLSPAWTAAMVITSSVPTGINAWLIANRFKVGQGLAASAVSLTTMAGFVTVSAWVWLMGL